MTFYQFEESDYKHIEALRILFLQVSEQQFVDEGFEFTYKAVAKLLDYIDCLEDYIDELEDKLD